MAVVEEAVPLPAPERLRTWASVAARPILEGIAALVLTAVLVIWLADLTLSQVSLEGLTLNLLLVGTEPFRGMSTLEALFVGLQRTGALLVAAMAVAALVGVGTGVAFAVSSSRLGRALAWGIGTLGIALPSFFWAMLLQLLVVEVFLATGRRPFPTSGFGLDAHLVLPMIALAARPTAYLFRVTATALEEVRHADYVRAARARGLIERFVLQRHMLPNALPAILSGFGIAARSAISSLAIVEYVFTWNGAGFGFIHALANRNVPLATATAVAFALSLALVGVLVGLAARVADPRPEGAAQ